MRVIRLPRKRETMRYLGFRMRPADVLAVVRIAKKRGTSVSEVVRDAVRIAFIDAREVVQVKKRKKVAA